MGKIKIIRITKPEQIGSGLYVDINTKINWNKKLGIYGFFHCVIGCPHKIPMPYCKPNNSSDEYINDIRRMPIWVWSSHIWEEGKGSFDYHSIRDMGVPYGDTFHNTTNQLFEIVEGTYEEVAKLTIEQFLKLEKA